MIAKLAPSRCQICGGILTQEHRCGPSYEELYHLYTTCKPLQYQRTCINPNSHTGRIARQLDLIEHEPQGLKKYCVRCNVAQSFWQFRKLSTGKMDSWCVTCRRDYGRQWMGANRHGETNLVIDGRLANRNRLIGKLMAENEELKKQKEMFEKPQHVTNAGREVLNLAHDAGEATADAASVVEDEIHI